MSYLNGLSDHTSLSSLDRYLSSRITSNTTIIERVLSQANTLNGLGDTIGEKVPFSEVVKKYNKGISNSEIQAWIWYKRQTGVPMTGWDKYYLSSNTKKIETEL